jgi:hypothetical protein
MSASTIASFGTAASGTGNCTQQKVIFAANSALWWAFYMDSTNNNQIKSKSSSDGATWTSRATLTLTNAARSTDGRNFSVCYDNIASNDVVHLIVSEAAAGESHHARGSISGTTLTWSSDDIIDNVHTNSEDAAGWSIMLDSNNRPIAATDQNGGNAEIYRATNTDSGTSWTSGWGGFTTIYSGALTAVDAQIILDLGSGNLLALCEDDTASGANSMKNVEWMKWTTTWSAAAAVFTGLGSGVSPNDFCACPLSTSDIHSILRTGASSYSHKRFNGTNWTTLSGASIPTLATKAGGGIPMVSDGTNVWAGAIGSDAANTVNYIKWTAGSWDAAWTALESSTQTRTFLGVCPQMNGTKILFYWTQTNGSNFDFVAAVLDTAAGGGGFTWQQLVSAPDQVAEKSASAVSY